MLDEVEEPEEESETDARQANVDFFDTLRRVNVNLYSKPFYFKPIEEKEDDE